jgi:hypothetical protein
LIKSSHQEQQSPEQYHSKDQVKSNLKMDDEDDVVNGVNGDERNSDKNKRNGDVQTHRQN